MCSDKSSTNQRADHDVVSPRGPTIFIANPHRGDGKRFVVRADEKLTAFLELESAIWRSLCSPGQTMPVRPHLTARYSDVTKKSSGQK
jgi:hypothetical protein